MSYKDFTADGVDYRLILTRKNNTTFLPVRDLDAIVRETGNTNKTVYTNWLNHDTKLANSLRTIKSTKMPVYAVDGEFCVDSKPLIYGFHTFHMILPSLLVYNGLKLLGVEDPTALAAIPISVLAANLTSMAIPHFSTNKLAKICTKLNQYFSFLKQAPVEETRNAICARKIKKGVVNKLKEDNPGKFEKRPPRIGIIYSAAHGASIESCLKSQTRTSLVLGLNRLFLPLIFEQKSLNDLHEYRINSDYSINHQISYCPVFS